MSLHFINYRNTPFHCFLIIILYYNTSFISAQTETITGGQLIRDGDTIISSNQRFTLGFFSLQNSSFRYVGIWYTSIPIDSHSIVWVANRENPISGNGGTFMIGNDGNLQVLDENRNTVWSSNGTVASDNSSAVLMETGDLVLHETGNMNRVFWSSFTYPTDTYLPLMRIHINSTDGEREYFSSWKSISDPAPGNYTMGLDLREPPQIIVWEGRERRWRSGHWNGVIFTGVPRVRAFYLFGIRLINEGDGRLYFTYMPSNTSDLIKFRIYWDGIERQERWNAGQRAWDVVRSDPSDQCERYNQCGPFGQCNEVNSRRCSCMQGFMPRDANQWNRGNWSGGCVRRAELQCDENNQGTDGFLGVNNVKLPDFVDYVGLENPRDCQRRCLDNCSCTGYAFVSGINCMIWYQDLVDVHQFEEARNTVFVRVARSELGNGGNNRSQVTRTIITSVVTVATFLLCCISIWILWKRRRESQGTGEFAADEFTVDMSPGTGPKLAMFSFNDVAVATDDFSNKNKLGQGGFGQVYKGILGKQEVAVKRLSMVSGQGLEEFKNEITVIAKLQHRNLVRLLGCCAQGEEKMLLYEYMPNKSLDTFLFDSEKKAQLDWSKRFNITKGIARGLVYLHRDSRLRIIHRDLKASNILLDEDLNPKISDFGMARIFRGNQNEENTRRVVGTYGYMAPEYAMEGLFSIKSDVYSFGVLLLEIVTGRRSISFGSTEDLNIIKYAWDLFNSGRSIELADPSISDSCSKEQVLRCIHVGILCVQDNAGHRPNMPAVILMLESQNMVLPVPKQPSFTPMRHNENDADMWNGNLNASSNNVTISVIVGR